MAVRTQTEIDAEIKRLRELKPKIPAVSFFGDNNRDAIEAQITVLKERLNEDEVLNRTQLEGENEDAEWSEHTGNAARDAANWLAGDEDEPPSKGWEPLGKVTDRRVRARV